MITYKLTTQKLGDIDIEIAKNLKNVQLHNIGEAFVSYSSFCPERILISGISTNPYDIDVNLKIISLLKEKNIDQKTGVIYNEKHIPVKAGMIISSNRPCDDEDNITGFTFQVPDELKQIITQEYMSICNTFLDKIRNGKIEIKYNGENIFVEMNLYRGLDTWKLFYHLLYSLNLHNTRKWDNLEKKWKAGDIVTNDIAPILDRELKIKEKAEKEQEEFIKKLFENVASHEETKPRRYNIDDDYEVIVSVVMKSGRIYKFSARNIEDFGLIINPLWREEGCFINIENYLNSNPDKIEWVNECRKITSSKYILQTFDRQIFGVNQEEMQAYEVAMYLCRGYDEIRL